MNIVSKVLHEKNQSQSCAFIPFITAGYPDIDTTIKALYIMDNKGADIIELGIPYADALADGHIIQESSKVALAQGVYIEQVFSILSEIYQKLSSPIVIFTYYNPILVKGIELFIKKISSLGVKGLLIPDLPIEEIDYVLELCKLYEIELILFVAPTSSENRINYILSKSSGCIYLVSSTGVTGTRNAISSTTLSLSKHIKITNNKLIMIGFGISNPEQASRISKWNIDGVVVGSGIIKAISKDKTLNLLSLFCESMKQAIS